MSQPETQRIRRKICNVTARNSTHSNKNMQCHSPKLNAFEQKYAMSQPQTQRIRTKICNVTALY